MKITFLGHSSFLIESNDYSIVFDPYKNGSVPGLVFPKNISSNDVLISHNHADHCGVENVNIIKKESDCKVEFIEVAHDHHNGSKRGFNKIYKVNIDGYSFVHLGDTGYVLNEKEIEFIKNADFIFGPINGFYTIDANEFKAIVDLAKPKVFIPMHYYMEKNKIGYPDDNQIDSFLKLIDSYVNVDSSIIVDENTFKLKCLVFNKPLQ